jgi:hypothetical protein
LEWKMLVCFTAVGMIWPFSICNIWLFGIVCGNLVYLSFLVCLDQEKSGNPAVDPVNITDILHFIFKDIIQGKNIFVFFSSYHPVCT